MKVKTIKLSDGWNSPTLRPGKCYRVEQITDSIEFENGSMLSRDVVASLCESRDWKVTIVPKKK